MEPETALNAWLGLPPGPWPPDHYALLALPPGTGDFNEIEARVLERMELLRQHQLRHPEPVTEGMNRLAQALVCLTDPVARAAYDRGLGIAPAPFDVVDAEPLAEETEEPVELPFGAELEPASEPARLPYEVVEPLPYEVVPDDQVVNELPLASEVLPEAPGPGTARGRAPVARPKPINRRAAYKRLAALRRALRAWEALRPALGDPGEALSTPVAVLVFLRALTSARSALPGVAFVLGRPHAPGRVVAALVRAPAVLSTVRSLLAGQRQSVARDWRLGYAALLRERDQLRGLLAARRDARHARANLIRAVRRAPESWLVVLAVVLVVVALVRGLG